MKSVVVLWLVFLGVGSAYSQYTAVPDLNFEAYLEANGMGDGVPGNGLVLTANIQNVMELQIPPFSNIIDITGIEDFTALEILHVAFNPVTSVDVSQNINLIELGIRDTAISSLNVNNDNLEILICYQNWELTSLTVSSMSLVDIDASENALNSIDVTNCPALEKLNVYYNYLSQIDISNNPNLTFLRAIGNPLQFLDTSGNPLLEILQLSHCNMENIDVSHNPYLTQFTLAHNHVITLIDVRNGSNESMEMFYVNPAANLQCVYVDDASASYLDDWSIPNHAQFANNEQECSPISVEEYQRPVFSFFPNPVKERLTVVAKEQGTYWLYSPQGKEIASGVLTPGFCNIYLADYPAGMYYLILESLEGKEVKKILRN